MRQMMTELEIGQRRVDKNGDVRTVNSIGETHAWLVRESDGTGKTYTLAAAQKLHMAPPLVRSIRLTWPPIPPRRSAAAARIYWAPVVTSVRSFVERSSANRPHLIIHRDAWNVSRRR